MRSQSGKIVQLTVNGYTTVSFPTFAGTYRAYTRRMGQAELIWVAGNTPRWFTRPQRATNCRIVTAIA